MSENKIVLSTTGHRPNRLPGGYNNESPQNVAIKDEFKKIIEGHLKDGKDVVCLSGMAIGVDTLFAIATLELRDIYKDRLQLFSIVPFKGQEKRWPQHSQDFYNLILEYADTVRILYDHYSNYALLKRNEYLVDNCDTLIAIWDGKENGGTYHAVSYAYKEEKDVIVIDPNKL